MKYNNFRIKVVDIKEANKILTKLRQLQVPIIFVDRYKDIRDAKRNTPDFSYQIYAIVKENDSNIFIETCYYEPQYKATRYVVNLNGENKATVKGLQCFNKLQQYCYKAIHAKHYNIELLDALFDKEEGRYLCSSKPIIGYDPRYEKAELKDIYEYDINSAYGSIMLQGIPDVNHPYINAKTKKNQVGFFIDEDLSMTEKPGILCDIVFDIIQLTDDQKKYINKLYNLKETAKTDYEHNMAKLALNAGIGYYQRFNPFIRAYIVQKCNNVILGLLDDETVLWNTDAIFSLKRRPELALGASIGEFKEIKIDRFVYSGCNYQINHEIPKYRGIPKAWFKDRQFDLLKDALPKRCNKYIYNETKAKLERNKEYENGV